MGKVKTTAIRRRRCASTSRAVTGVCPSHPKPRPLRHLRSPAPARASPVREAIASTTTAGAVSVIICMISHSFNYWKSLTSCPRPVSTYAKMLSESVNPVNGNAVWTPKNLLHNKFESGCKCWMNQLLRSFVNVWNFHLTQNAQISTNLHNFTDINECVESSPCRPNQQCENTVGSYVCRCGIGFRYNAATQNCEGNAIYCTDLMLTESAHGLWITG